MKPFSGVFWALVFLAFARPALAAGPHYVFAHYMVCYSDYGQSIAGYEHDIQDAQAAGIDGFALDVGDYDDPAQTYYNTNIFLMYAAAEQLSNGFKLFFSVDMGDNTNAIVDMIHTYANRTNSFHYQGRLVVSSFCGNGGFWTNGVFQPLQALGVSNLFFIPFFAIESGYNYYTESAGASNLLVEYNFLNGMFDFACGLPNDINYINASYCQACTNAGKLFMAGCSPSYWGDVQTSTGRTYFESQGGEGAILQWNWIIQNQPDWVEIVTWNDFNEDTYVSPIMNPEQYEGSVITPHRYSHAGYLALFEHYIPWYKTGVEPPVNQDSIYYFYRTHSTNAVASNTNDVPVSVYMGNVQDVIYTTTFLTSPAQLVVASGNTLTTNTVPAGISSQRTPFAPGAQTFTLVRGGRTAITLQGPNILAHITNYDYFPASGALFGPVPPANLRVQQ